LALTDLQRREDDIAVADSNDGQPPLQPWPPRPSDVSRCRCTSIRSLIARRRAPMVSYAPFGSSPNLPQAR